MMDMLNGIDITPKNDVIFKILFGKERHAKFLIHLLNALLKPNDPIINVEIKSSELTNDDVQNWWVRLDILAETSNNEIINIELQKSNLHNFIERAMYYESLAFSGQHVEKQNYAVLKKTIFIAILNFYLFKNDDRYWHKHVWKDDQTNERTPRDLQEMNYFELPKIRKRYDMKHDALWFWLKFIDNPYDEELKDMYKVEKICGEVKDAYEACVADEKTRELLRIRKKAEMDYHSELAAVEQESFKKGALQKAIETAKKMLDKGMSIEDVADISELSLEEVQALKKSL